MQTGEDVAKNVLLWQGRRLEHPSNGFARPLSRRPLRVLSTQIHIKNRADGSDPNATAD